MSDEIAIRNFEKSVYLTEKLHDYLLKELADEKPEKQYYISYWQHFKKSKLSGCEIKLKSIKNFNTSIGIGSMMDDENTQFTLNLWKYNGEHFFKDYRYEDISENDFPKMLDLIKTFFDIKKRCVQLSLFGEYE